MKSNNIIAEKLEELIIGDHILEKNSPPITIDNIIMSKYTQTVECIKDNMVILIYNTLTDVLLSTVIVYEEIDLDNINSIIQKIINEYDRLERIDDSNNN